MSEYRVTVDCLMMWFPSKPGSTLSGPLLQGATFTHFSNEPAKAHTLTDYLLKDTLFGPNCSVAFSVDSGLFVAAVRLELFGATRMEQVALPPNARVPFLLQVDQGSTDSMNVVGTTGVFQGVFSSDGIVNKPLTAHRAR